MNECQTYKLGEICSRLKSGKGIPATEVFNIGNFPVIGGNGVRGYCEHSNFEGCCAVIGRQGAYCGNVRFFEGKAYMTEHAIVVIGNDLADTRYLAYLLSTMQLGTLSAQSVQPGLSVNTLKKLPITIHQLAEQKRIAKILGALDDKIELNRRINANLELQAQTLFKYYFIDNTNLLGTSIIGNLTDIAHYQNGLAMQKFRPKDNELAIPVLKIKELGQGECNESSDLCSSSINSDYIISDGDIIFSWSGTLLVDIWCGGKCGLNQHLFKVTSDTYPKWFIYYWTKYHLDKFIRIAKDKTVTMGHIRRCDLETSTVLIPSENVLTNIDALISPILDSIIKNRVVNKKLSQLRDTLLPKLMAREINV
ncbi:MAG: restriction endonuclease subunit S [Bacteroidaceae bacterium]|nr:restriction endonuclease subunit S [Bacteroidaceae bacterium]